MPETKVTLAIDTTDSSQTLVAIVKDGKRSEYKEKTDVTTKSQNVLPMIKKALQVNGLSLEDISEISVNPGPGSFTGVRVGVAVANTLGWILGVLVNGKKVVTPVYSASKFDTGELELTI